MSDTEQPLTFGDARASIRLENVTKRFPGQTESAVDELTMEVREGEIVVLVGPSGCGKTTTMRLINRLVEPTSGRIILDGEDVTAYNPDLLRRRIGYVIQQVGLFPHMTIQDNIATVLKMLRRDRQHIRERVDNLLTMVGMEPEMYRRRYPKQLSGGERQRVGVARAMAADPSVMLMDEPFGAIDPITRGRLQDEFLVIQKDMKKTIVFVTHDVDEAIKIGDRIAILQGQSRIAQYDRPERILMNPANEFVADFIGRGATLKRLGLIRIYDVKLGEWPTVPVGTNRNDVVRVLEASGKDYVLTLDADGRPQQWIHSNYVASDDNEPHSGIGLSPSVVERTATLSETLDVILTAPFSRAVVVGSHGTYVGVVDIDVINNAIRTMGCAFPRRRNGPEGLTENGKEAVS